MVSNEKSKLQDVLACLKQKSKGSLAVTRDPFFDVHLDEIEIMEVIGSGSFGEVLKAEWQGHFVAVKRSHLKLNSMGSVLIEDFQKELSVWKPLRHPNVVPLMAIIVD